MDFDQRNLARIHDFRMNFDLLSERLHELSKDFPSGVIIPIIDNDLKSPVLTRMVSELNECSYLKKVFIALSAKSVENYEEAKRLFKNFKIPYEVVWCNKPEVATLFEELKKKGLDVTDLSGKGKDVWIAMGIASLELHSFVVHDADILYYSKMLPTKMLYPVVEPKLDFFFSKGYYARINLENKKMYGRISRLFINPVLEAMQQKLNHRSKIRELPAVV